MLYLAPPLAHTAHTLRTYLQNQVIPFIEPSAGILAIPLAPKTLQTLSTGLPHVLSSVEIQDTRTLILPEDVTPTLAQFMAVRPLHTLLATVEGEWLIAMLRAERLTTFFQPIVSCADPRIVFAHECLMRGTDTNGQLVGAGEILKAARDAGILFHLDRAARLTAVREAVVHKVSTNIFINFNPTAIYDPANCLRTTINAIKTAAISPERIVFEVVESDEIMDTDHLLRILAAYRNAGFRVALDDLGAGYNSLNLLGKLHPDFIKLDREIVRDVSHDPYRAEIATTLLELAHTLGVIVIAEGVETEDEWHWLQQHGATYVQGFLFGKPASPPPPVEAARFALGTCHAVMTPHQPSAAR